MLIFRARIRIFIFTMQPKMVLGSNQPPIQWAFLLRIKQLEHEAEVSPSSTNVHKAWSFTSTALTQPYGLVLGHGDNFRSLPMPPTLVRILLLESTSKVHQNIVVRV